MHRYVANSLARFWKCGAPDNRHDVLNDTALPATLTALHVALAMLRRHRAHGSALSPFVLPSFIFPVAPWLWTSAIGLAITTVGHLLWTAICEALAPPSAVTASPRPPSPATKPAAKVVASGASTRRQPIAESRVSVLAVLDETPDIKTFRLSRPPDYEFTSGQFVPVRISIDGKPHIRCYSISSSPDAHGYIEISVRRQGRVSSTLHALLRPGASVSLGRPAGRFVYPAGDDRPIALLAGGVGITPVLSMLRYAVSREPLRPVTLLYSARKEHDVAFVSELKTIAERHPHVRVAITVTQPQRETRWRTGRLDAAMIRQHVSDPAHTIFLMCGPAAMMSDLREVLLEMGVPSEQVRSEAFETTLAASVLHADAALSAPVSTVGRDSTADAYEVRFAVSGRTTTNAPARTLLEAAEAEGISISSSCRAGVCQSCRTKVSAGDVDCRSDMLSPDDREAGFVLPCVSWAVADCTLEA